ncbi:MAG: IS66 family transposase, partial [Streptosporangiaceae bacterium]|nr:IS66 family transposase [Streptosporangiaceae bacterium]
MIVELAATLRQERQDKEALRQRLDLLLRRLYGPKSERVNPDQLLLFADADDDAAPASDPDTSAPAASAPERPPRKRRCRPHGRRPLPAQLPRRPLHHELSEAERICRCGQARVDIGTEVTEQLDWQPASYFVWQHLTHKYVCPQCAGRHEEAAMATSDETPRTLPAAADPPGAAAAATDAPATGAAPPIGPAIVTAPKPAMPIAKGLPGPGLLAHIIVSKYFDHLPLYRQEHIFQRHGLVLKRSTTCDWMAACAELLRPLYDLMVTVVLQSVWLHTDDTPVQNRRHDPGATPTGRFWLYYGDRAHPYNVFDFTVNRKRDGPQTFLADFHGYLHADAFSGYDALYLPAARAGTAPIQEVACNAHARRKFYEARGSDSLAAHRALAYYGQLYELEAAATRNGFDDDQRRRMRQELAVPILEQFHTWLEDQRQRVLPKSPLAEAVGYALNNWNALIRYTEAGFLAIDNNVAEREMKRIAIGRKNWLFVGSAKGGHTAAVLFSFTSTCARLRIEPWAYLQDVLTRLPRTPAGHLGAL